MGGGGGSYGGGGSVQIDYTKRCSGPFKFSVIITDNTQKIWGTCAINQEIYINVSVDTLPRLEVRRQNDELEIGVVPATQSIILSCIKEGWSYTGKITKISGNQNNPDIQVEIMGDN